MRGAVKVHVQFIFLQKWAGFGSVGPDRPQFTKEIFKPRWRNHFNKFAWGIARVPGRMPLIARFEDPCMRLSCDNRVAKQYTEGPSQHMGKFVFAVMAVQRRHQCTRRHYLMNDRKAVACLRSVDLPVHAISTKIELIPRARWN